MKSNAERQREFRQKLRNMVSYSPMTLIYGRTVRNKKSGDIWKVTTYWPEYGYYSIERETKTNTPRVYYKSILVSKRVLEVNYVEIP